MQDTFSVFGFERTNYIYSISIYGRNSDARHFTHNWTEIDVRLSQPAV